jgi:ATP-dependent RNA helicase DHX37/DHR1
MANPTPRIRKRRALARLAASHHPSNGASSSAVPADSNVAEIVPGAAPPRASAAENHARRKADQPQSRLSRRKQKRLDKYVAGKMQKDLAREMLGRLAGTRVDVSGLRSMGSLGRGRKVFEGKGGGRSWGSQGTNVGADESDSGESESGAVVRGTHEEAIGKSKVDEHESKAGNNTSEGGFGAGLKRPLEVDEEGRPVIKMRKKLNGKRFSVSFEDYAPVANVDEPTDDEPADESARDASADDESEWEGFGSDDGLVTNGGDSHVAKDIQDLDIDDDSESSQGSQSEDGSDTESDESDSQENRERSKAEATARTSAFKAWAEQQRNEAVGFVPTTVLSMAIPPSKAQHVPRPPEQDPLPPELEVKQGANRKAYTVPVGRSEEIQAERLKLPIAAKEQQIMEAIFNNDVVIISGATGSGKTTQVPQFLFENGFGDPSGPAPGMIGVTQPRRVAAVSMAQRVATELGGARDRVSHQIRFDTTVHRATAVKFMTDGVLLREMAADFSLARYSAVVVDEAHERTVNTDILVALLSRCVRARAELAREMPARYAPLKLVIMSATLRVDDFRENRRLFGVPPPLVEAEGRQFGVTVHWSRRTGHDYVGEAFRKVARGHRQLPPGGMLVFLAGQDEIRTLARRLRAEFEATEPAAGEKGVRLRVAASEMAVEEGDLDIGEFGMGDERDEEHGSEGEEDEDDDEFQIGEEERPVGEDLKMHILPLYSQLPSAEQLRVFQPAPPNSRLIVLATNVAETSLTIPGIRYVVDAGRAKSRKWDRAGVQAFKTAWVSKAAADQRSGRAGRTGPGHCYRLYSSAVYEAMAAHAEPEMARAPVEGVVLQLKALGVARVDNFPFPTPPERPAVLRAERVLACLGALDAKGAITAAGREMQAFPLGPRFAQMLRLGIAAGCADLVIALVAALDAPELLVPRGQLDLSDPAEEQGVHTAADDDARRQREARRKAYGGAHAKLARLDPASDAAKLLAALLLAHRAPDRAGFCREHFLRDKAVAEAAALRGQLAGAVNALHPGAARSPAELVRVKLPDERQVKALLEVAAAGFVDQVAVRADLLPDPPQAKARYRRAIDVPYRTLLDEGAGDGWVYVHPSSVLARLGPGRMPAYIVYQRLQRSHKSSLGADPAGGGEEGGKAAKTRMHPLTPVTGAQLARLARGTALLRVSKPRGKVVVVPSGDDGVERRRCAVDLSVAGGEGGLGWMLERREVVQRRERVEGWVVEEFL